MRSVLTCITRRTIVTIQTLPHTPLSEYTRENNIAKGKKSGQQGKHIQTGKQDSALPSHLSTLRLPQVPNEGGREAENCKVGDDVRDGVAEEEGQVVYAVAVGERYIPPDSDGSAEKDGDGDLGIARKYLV